MNASNTGFAMMAGGGLDIKVSKHIAFRPIGADYYLTRIPSLLTGDTSNRNNFRYSAGINFLIGSSSRSDTPTDSAALTGRAVWWQCRV